MTQKKVVESDVAMAWLKANNVSVSTSRGGSTKGPNKQEQLKQFILNTFKSKQRPPSRDECMTHLYGNDKDTWKANAFKNYCTYLRGGDNYKKKKYRIDLVESNGTVYVVGYPNADFTDLRAYDEVK